MPLLTPFFVLLTGLEPLLIKQLVRASAVRMSRDRAVAREVWRALKRLEVLSAAPRT